MAFVTNGFLASFCFFAYFNLKNDSGVNYHWKMFYLIFGCSTFFAMFGHTFFLYTGVYGKFPSWILGSVANIYAALGVMQYNLKIEQNSSVAKFIVFKSFVLLATALATQKFVFVAIDAILTYIMFTGFYAYRIRKQFGINELKYMNLGVFVLLPSAFFFLLKINLHRWLNKDDISHLLMLGGIFCFYLSVKKVQIANRRLLKYV